MKNKLKITSRHPPLFLGSASLLVSLPLSYHQHSGIGNWGHILFITPCLCHSFILTHFPMESLSKETVLHELLQHESFPWATVFPKVLQHGSFPCGHKFCQQICCNMGSSLHVSTGPANKATSVQASHRVTASHRHPPTPT